MTIFYSTFGLNPTMASHIIDNKHSLSGPIFIYHSTSTSFPIAKKEIDGDGISEIVVDGKTIEKGSILNGKRHGKWSMRTIHNFRGLERYLYSDVETVDSGNAHDNDEGDYLNGEKNGVWISVNWRGTVIDQKVYDDGKELSFFEKMYRKLFGV